MKETALFATIALGLAACGSDTGAGEGPDFDLMTARAHAVSLGEYLAPLVDGVGQYIDDAEQAGDEREAANVAALRAYFGERVTSEPTADGYRFDDSFLLGPAPEQGPDDALTIDGRPLLVVWTLTGGPGFFYEPTIVDTRTGAVYHGYTDLGTRPVAEWQFYGPLSPPEESRVTGHFDGEDLWELYTGLREGISNWQP